MTDKLEKMLVKKVIKDINVFLYALSKPFYIIGLLKMRKYRGLRFKQEELSRINQFPGTSDRIIRRQIEYCAGKQIRFSTESKKIMICVLYSRKELLPHMSLYGVAGIDLYNEIDDNFITNIHPVFFSQSIIGERLSLPKNCSNYCLYLPLYSSCYSLQLISLDDKPIERYTNYDETICFYGSSITQGCAASRPGMAYPNILSRKLKMNTVNYGLSESAKGQAAIISDMAKKDYNIYIIEYDHNSSIEELSKRHKEVYEILRQYSSNSIIIFMSRYSAGLSLTYEEYEKRVSIIKDTFLYAKSCHDRKVLFINGSSQIRNSSSCFVDDRHPNDYGMSQIAEIIAEEICKYKEGIRL